MGARSARSQSGDKSPALHMAGLVVLAMRARCRGLVAARGATIPLAAGPWRRRLTECQDILRFWDRV